MTMSSHRVRPGSSIGDLIHLLSAGPAKTKRVASGPRSPSAAVRANVRDPAVLRQELVVLAAGVDLDSESAVRALRRPVVRRILLWEFGESFLEHPDFQGALATIESAMDADPAPCTPAESLALQPRFTVQGALGRCSSRDLAPLYARFVRNGTSRLGELF